MTDKQWGTPVGATFWYKPLKDGTFKTMRCKPGMVPPEPGWLRGQRPRTEDEKKHLSEKNMGRVMTEEWRARMSAASKGRPKSEAHKAAMSVVQKELARKRKAGEA